MPNWCMNYLYINNVDDVQKIKRMVSSDDDVFDVGVFSPNTDNQRMTDSGIIGETDDSISFSFDSAWGPPENAIVELASMLPDCVLTLQYYEPGMMFAGEIIYKNGDMFEEEHLDYDSGIDYYNFIFDKELESKESYAKTEDSYLYFSELAVNNDEDLVLYHNEWDTPNVNSIIKGVVNDNDDNYIESDLITFNGEKYIVKLKDGKLVNFGS